MTRHAAAATVLAACAVAGAVRLPGAVGDARHEARRDARATAEIPAIPGTPEGMPELLARVRELVPEDEPVRLVVNGTTCTALPLRAGAGLTFWIQYHLAPRPLTCSPGARWWVLVGGTPSPPPGAAVTVVRPNLLVARVGP